jgi:prepilin-type processing-associated H-X9-DG protein
VSPGSCPWAGRPIKSDSSYRYYGWAIDRADDDDLVALSWWTDEFPISAQYLAVFGCCVAGGLYDLTYDDFDQDCVAGQDVPGWVGSFPPNIGNGGGNTLYRLKEGIERFMITNINNPAGSAIAQSDLPVMWDWVAGTFHMNWFNHVPGGSNVLYMDGHVQFIRYPGKFPLSKNGEAALMST